jgi:hypothetical protein
MTQEMIITVEAGDLFGRPNRKHLWTTIQNTLNTIPIDFLKKV